MRLVLLGPPGAGKGTQAKVLSQNLGLIHLSTGNIFREAAKKQDELGNQLADFMQRGELVPNDIVNKIVMEKLKDKDLQDRFILDGYPRTGRQAAVLDEFLEKNNIPLDIVIYMQTSKEVAIERLTGRRVCEKCGMNYHVKNIKPKKPGVCDTCNVNLIQREDDNEETVLKRFDIYHEQTSELISYYKEKGILETVSGDLQVNKLYKVLNTLFEQKGLL